MTLRAASLVLAMAIGAEASAQAAKLPPANQAAGLALMQCVAHITGTGVIAAETKDHLKANGLELEGTPPPHLRALAQNEYGRGTIARSPSAEGEVWAAGYDGGVCIVMTIGAEAAPVEKRMVELFSIPNSFKPEPIGQREGVKVSQWRWKQSRMDILANMTVRGIPAPGAKDMVMVTVAAMAPGSK